MEMNRNIRIGILSDYGNVLAKDMVKSLYGKGFKKIFVMYVRGNRTYITKGRDQIWMHDSRWALVKRMFRFARSSLATRLMAKYYSLPAFNSKETRILMKELRLDIAVPVNSGILDADIITIPKSGMIVSHPGILPKYRGASGKYLAVLNNDDVGVTVFRLAPAVDTGDIALIQKIDKTTLLSLDDFHQRLYQLMISTTVKVICQIAQGTARFVPQNKTYPYHVLTEREMDLAREKWKEIFKENRRQKM